MRAMIFAAGLGTRLQSLTSEKPKAMVEINGKPMLEHSINYLKHFGVNELVVNVHHFADQIIDFIKSKKNFGIDVKISDERDLLLETGGGLKKASSLFIGSDPVILYNVDVFSNLDLNQLLFYHQKHQALATLVVRERKSSRYLLFDNELQLAGWKDVRTGEVKIGRPSTINESGMFAFSGIHIIDPQIFKLITEDGKFSVIDLYLRLASEYNIKAFVDRSEFWLDLGKATQLAEAEKIIKNYYQDKK